MVQNCGKFVASGCRGKNADIIVWDVETQKEALRYKALHPNVFLRIRAAVNDVPFPLRSMIELPVSHLHEMPLLSERLFNQRPK